MSGRLPRLQNVAASNQFSLPLSPPRSFPPSLTLIRGMGRPIMNHAFIDRVRRLIGEHTRRQARNQFLHLMILAGLHHVIVDQHILAVKLHLLLHVTKQSPDQRRQVNDHRRAVLLKNGIRLRLITQISILGAEEDICLRLGGDGVYECGMKRGKGGREEGKEEIVLSIVWKSRRHRPQAKGVKNHHLMQVVPLDTFACAFQGWGDATTPPDSRQRFSTPFIYSVPNLPVEVKSSIPLPTRPVPPVTSTTFLLFLDMLMGLLPAS